MRAIVLEVLVDKCLTGHSREFEALLGRSRVPEAVLIGIRPAVEGCQRELKMLADQQPHHLRGRLAVDVDVDAYLLQLLGQHVGHVLVGICLRRQQVDAEVLARAAANAGRRVEYPAGFVERGAGGFGIVGKAAGGLGRIRPLARRNRPRTRIRPAAQDRLDDLPADRPLSARVWKHRSDTGDPDR